MRQTLNCVFVMALLATAGCTAKAPAQPDRNEQTLRATLKSLNLQNPASDAMRNFGKGDLRLIGVNGYSCSLPGRPVPAQEELAQKNGMYCLEGTSDVGLRQLNQQAWAYALHYNVALLKLMHR